MNADIEKLQKLGYEIEVAIEGYEDVPTVFSVSGFGMQNVQVTEDDTETWKRLANKKAHDSRVLQEQDEVSDRERLVSDFAAQVALGDITQEEADEMLKKADDNQPPKTQSELLAEAIDKLPADRPLTKEDLLSVLTA